MENINVFDVLNDWVHEINYMTRGIDSIETDAPH